LSLKEVGTFSDAGINLILIFIPKNKMTVQANKVVSVAYQLEVNDLEGERDLVETVSAEQPMLILYGMSGLPEKFEEEIAGLSAGDSFKFSIAPEEGYGDIDEEAIVPIPLDTFRIDGEINEEMLQIGNYIPMTDNFGNQLKGCIVSVDADTVVMDFNHPLAGKTMFFTGEIVAIRDAQPEELAHGHAHGEGGHHH
jgi:FKBP-type peptidyl-prolyl cis-trans isomerase SlyD